MGIPNGFVYELRCGREPSEVRDHGAGGTQCAEAFGSSNVDGGTDGFGDSASSFDISIDNDSGGCSGGCGGGGD